MNFQFSMINFQLISKSFKLKKNIACGEAGFTIAEIIIAISLLSFGIVLVYGSIFMIRNATYNTSLRFTASHLGREGLEIMISAIVKPASPQAIFFFNLNDLEIN